MTATASGPVAGQPANAMPAELAERYGYVEEERFLSGEATEYEVVGEVSEDGMWTVEPGATAPFRTRIIVRRPADPAHFNGTVVVEWFNVTAGVDADPDFGLLHPLLLGEGYGYVGVSAQQVAVGGGKSALDIPIDAGLRLPLTERDPERYGTLTHPGDGWSYDIYAQVAVAVRHGDLLGGATPERVIAIGESQSAFRMVSFINAVQPVTGAYDGFLVHSRGGSSAPPSGNEVQADPRSGPPRAIRTDLDVPVLQYETETDLTLLGYLAARQPDTDRIVTWEVAGTAHADATILEYGRMANKEARDFDIAELYPALNRGPQAQVLRAALVALVEWVASGTTPPSAPPIETDGERLRRADDGIVLGGIRTPAVDVPISVLSGESADEDNIFAQLFGETVPFTAEELQARYATHDDYVAQVTASADAAVAARFLLPADRDAFVAAAEAAAVPPIEGSGTGSTTTSKVDAPLSGTRGWRHTSTGNDTVTSEENSQRRLRSSSAMPVELDAPSGTRRRPPAAGRRRRRRPGGRPWSSPGACRTGRTRWAAPSRRTARARRSRREGWASEPLLSRRRRDPHRGRRTAGPGGRPRSPGRSGGGAGA